jgi:Ca-activated chloride channel homolog
MKFIFIISFLLYPYFVYGQKELPKKILFVVDGSGSMKEQWNGEMKWTIAMQTLSHIIDSIQKSHQNISFGIRILGHQNPREEKNCTDSKLELKFNTKQDKSSLESLLSKIQPQGQTPIVYALSQAFGDFENAKETQNSIILITDGFETCDGDLCAIADSLKKKRISINPYIIGLGVQPQFHERFKCVGTFIDAKEKKEFVNIVSKVVKQNVSKTSTQIVLIDKNQNIITDPIAYTIYDTYSGNTINTYINTVGKNNRIDTQYLDPMGTYNIVSHTKYALMKKNVVLKVGMHNVVYIQMPEGKFSVKSPNVGMKSVVRYQDEILTTTPIVVENRLIENPKYEIEVMSGPMRNIKDQSVSTEAPSTVNIPAYGSLSITAPDAGVLMITDDRDNRVIQKNYKIGVVKIDLLPGKYTCIYRNDKAKSTMKSVAKAFEIISTKILELKL